MRYATQNGREFSIEKEEMAAFLGINFVMSINILPNIESYWCADEFIGNKRIQNVMTRQRFQSILQNLHFSNNEDDKDADDKARKIRKIIDHFNKSFQAARDNSSK